MKKYKKWEASLKINGYIEKNEIYIYILSYLKKNIINQQLTKSELNFTILTLINPTT